ncbi:MAG: hypothetical protein ACK2U9_19765, partial [Anaerolineae bacterium]
SRLDPAGKPGMLSDMLPYSLDLHSAEAARSQLDFLAELLEGLPGHRLSLGRDRHDLPHILSTLLRSA